MALDSNFVTVVDNLEDINWNRDWDGRPDIRQPGPPIVLFKWAAQAVVLIPQQRAKEEIRFIITKWQKSKGAWRLNEDMRINMKTIKAIASQEVQDKINALS